MAGEAALWRYLRDGMRGRWHAQRHEDRVARGVPDTSYALGCVDGWLELKSLSAWPKRPATPVKCGLTFAQSVWLRQRGHIGGGRCYVLLRVGRCEHLLFRYDACQVLVDGAPKNVLQNAAIKVWPDGIDFDELEWLLRS